MKYVNSITSDFLPSSFVKENLKFADDTGHGEAKLYLNKENSSKYYNDFFENYNDSNQYYFSKQNLLDYLNSPIIINEYLNNRGQYKNIDNNYRLMQVSRISQSLLKELIPLEFEKRVEVDSQARYYIRSFDNIFRELFRSIAIPKHTYLKIDKYEDEEKDNYIYYCFLMSI